MRILSLFLVWSAFLFLLLNGFDPLFAQEIERRKEQFSNEPAYGVAPLPYSYPGIGEGWLVGGFALNIFETNLDLAAVKLFGDIEGIILGFSDLHLLAETLILDYGFTRFDKVSVAFYYARGTDSSPEDMIFIGVGDIDQDAAQLTWSFWDRRVELKTFYYGSRHKFKTVRNEEGDLVIEFDESQQEYKKIYSSSFRLEFDYTDDKIDPRKGVRYSFNAESSPIQSPGESDYQVIDHSATLYFPIGKISTLAFNYFKSDAFVKNEGATDRDELQQDLGFRCEILGNTENRRRCENFLTGQAARNKYGTATSLGGPLRLRSYPQSRFQGAHTRFAGVEFRWNLTEEFTPFNLYFLKDTRTGIQIAFFYEAGTVADLDENLFKSVKSSYGVGLRILAGSGYAYRLDLPTGEEGISPNMVFTYPW